MDRMDLDELHREQIKRARSINPSISDLRLAVDAAAEMQACPWRSPASLILPEVHSVPLSLLEVHSVPLILFEAHSLPLSLGCCSAVKPLLPVSQGLLSLSPELHAQMEGGMLQGLPM